MSDLTGTWGMLWHFDDPKKSLDESIDVAIEYFVKKYNKQPIYIEVSNKNTDEKSFRHNDIECVSQRYFGKNYLWIRIENYVK